MGTCGRVFLVILCVILMLPALILGVFIAINAGKTIEGAAIAACLFVVALVPVFGIWGAVGNNRGALITFIVLISIGLAVSISIGVLLLVVASIEWIPRAAIKAMSYKQLRQQIKYWMPKEGCCGCVYKQSAVVPMCVLESLPDCCVEVLNGLIYAATVFGAASLALALLQVVSIVIACILCYEIGQKPETVMLAPIAVVPLQPGMPQMVGMPQSPGMPQMPGTPPTSGTSSKSDKAPVPAVPGAPSKPRTSLKLDTSRVPAAPPTSGTPSIRGTSSKSDASPIPAVPPTPGPPSKPGTSRKSGKSSKSGKVSKSGMLPAPTMPQAPATPLKHSTRGPDAKMETSARRSR